MSSTHLRFTKGEELANTISHGVGVVFALIGLIVLIILSAKSGSALQLVSVIIFGSSMTVLYLSSTLNHGLKHGKAKEFFHNFDQVAIFLLIAGSYTPIALVALHGDWGWLMFGLQWSFAITGIVTKIFLPNRFEKGVNIFFIIAYIIMGWMLLFFLIPLLRHISPTAMLLLLIGGGFYTVGTIFFKLKNVPYSHLIWHIFVIAGSALHWVAIMSFVLPLNM
jgi:hemolysin III